MFSRVYQPSTSVSMSWEQCFFFFVFLQIYSSRCTSTFTFVGSHLRLCVHAYVCEACRRPSADICFCACNLCVSMHICVFMCVCMNAQAQICLVKVIFLSYGSFPRDSVYLFVCSWIWSLQVYICMQETKPESHYEWIIVAVASSCTVEDRLNVPEQDAIRGGAAGQ